MAWATGTRIAPLKAEPASDHMREATVRGIEAVRAVTPSVKILAFDCRADSGQRIGPLEYAIREWIIGVADR